MTRSEGFGALTIRPPGRALKAGFVVCLLIAVGVVLRRLVALSSPPDPNLPPQMAALDTAFASHASLTYVHILTALAFVLLLPLLFLRRTRNSLVVERLVFLIGLFVGLSALAMTRYAVGGWAERSAVLVFDAIYLTALGRAWVFSRRGNRTAKQRWMLRAIAVLLGIATTRPVMGVFFATSRVTHLTPAQFFGIAFWIGFSINWMVIELWLRRRRSA